MRMRELKPDLELLRRIEELRLDFYLAHKSNGPIMEVDERIYFGLIPFLESCKAKEAIEELFFYMVNFVPPLPNESYINNLFDNEKAFFTDIESFYKLNFDNLQFINLGFNDGKKYDIPPFFLKYLGNLIEQTIKSEIEGPGKLPEIDQKIKKGRRRNTHQGEIKASIPAVEAIIQAKAPNVRFSQTDKALCTYAIFYARGYELNFNAKKHAIKEETDPFEHQSFDRKRVSNNILKE